ncbi:substrate-binding domain-containing protein [Butyrivibrio sp. LC3010]|uniref:substrate-binding domain-containing protein n=1 Tax=Butyrivibrio sp. LC3010 TaxID=1280680 RepID=UPI001FA6ED5C|nr:sugar-binding protein [Butyrivibrio sp. LC3010]
MKETSSVNSSKSKEDKPEIVDTHSDDGRTVVGISMPDVLLERWNHDGVFLQDQFTKRGCEVIIKYANNLIDTQVSDLRSMISEGADILVITPVDGTALSTVLDEAKSANVRVIAYDRLIMDSDAVDYYVSFDNYMVGVLQANYIIKALRLDTTRRAKNIEFVSGDPVDNNARYFYRGAIDTLKPYLDSGKLTVLSAQRDFYETSTAQWSTDIAKQRLQIILNSYYPDGIVLDAVLCANDSTALGAARAIEADYHESNRVVLTGQDGDIANIYNIINGTQSMTVYKALRNESVVAVTLGMSLLSGKKPTENLIKESEWDFDCTYNTSDYNNGTKVIPSYLLQPISITADNLEQELFDTGYYSRNHAGLIYAAE